jgi:hypothetical protein
MEAALGRPAMRSTTLLRANQAYGLHDDDAHPVALEKNHEQDRFPFPVYAGLKSVAPQLCAVVNVWWRG